MDSGIRRDFMRMGAKPAGAARLPYSALILASSMTREYFSYCSPMCAAKSFGSGKA
jgi:hypothetical protein